MRYPVSQLEIRGYAIKTSNIKHQNYTSLMRWPEVLLQMVLVLAIARSCVAAAVIVLAVMIYDHDHDTYQKYVSSHCISAIQNEDDDDVDNDGIGGGPGS